MFRRERCRTIHQQDGIVGCKVVSGVELHHDHIRQAVAIDITKPPADLSVYITQETPQRLGGSFA
jgi:hypothetical protein